MIPLPLPLVEAAMAWMQSNMGGTC
jgi:hypothetical protein